MTYTRIHTDYSKVSTKPVESHPYFVALFLNEDGLFQMKSSGPMRRYERHILEEALHKFKDIMENYIELTGMRLLIHTHWLSLIDPSQN